MKKISDKKALILQKVSSAIKQLVGLRPVDEPNWTNATEQILSEISYKSLDDLSYLLTALYYKNKIKKQEVIQGMIISFYQCPNCDHQWHEEYECACDSECPNCGLKAITPKSFQTKYETTVNLF